MKVVMRTILRRAVLRPATDRPEPYGHRNVTLSPRNGTPANAEPGENPCEFAISYFCKFLPMAPELEGDIDLTQQQPVDPNAPPPESLPVADPCAGGCI